MSSRCKNCGGSLEYDITAAKVKCLNCDSLFDPEEYKENTNAEEQASKNQYQTKMFICPSCGAEISNTEYDVVDYCLYCGTFVSLESQLTKVRKPTHIIPFTRTKEDCKKAYRDALKYKIYAPSEFRDEKFLEGFRGIYVPFWNYQYECGPEIVIRGEEDKDRDGDYINVQEYKIKANFSAKLDNIAYDASSTFDDEISLRIAPYSKENFKEFNTSYMFGFFGDIADIDKDVYKETSDTEIKEKLWHTAIADKETKSGHPVEELPSSMEKDFQMKSNQNLVMLPVWFLTWRKGDRVAYSVVNGETGKVYTETPVSVARYMLFSLLTAIPIFFALNFSVTFSAFQMLSIAICLAFFMIMLYVFQLDKIVKRIMHIDDKGFLETHEDAKKESEKYEENFVSVVFEGILEMCKVLGWQLILLIAFFIFKPELPAIGVLITVLGVPLYTFYRLYKDAKMLKDKTIYLDVLGAILSMVFGASILIADPAPDEYYYFSAMACMVGVALAAISMVNRYNQFLTRPVPHFFRKEAKS